MLTGQDIRAALKESLAGLFPGERIYENVTPDDFDRPSSLGYRMRKARR